jgi:two-component system CheB/CheR fusion protein
MESSHGNVYLVGIGASAGGLDAIQKLFDHIPEDTGMSFIIVQHLSPDFKSLMPELLAKHTSMTIYTAEDKQLIEPNCIYLTQRNKNLHVKDNKLFLLDQGPKHGLNLPIDIFFHTLGEEYKDRSVGIILSGTGSDGSRGIKTIKEAGGIVFVQDPLSAQFDGMPNSAIATHMADYILTPEMIAEGISKLPQMQLPFTNLLGNSDNTESNFIAILDEVYKYSGIDFKQYKRNTLIRRIEKRLHFNNIDNVYDYLTLLKSNSQEKELLKQDFLIGVTSFFRDTEAFEQLSQKTIANLFKIADQNNTIIRIWVVSCSTGEEAYSIAILLEDYIQQHQLKTNYKIFATDVDTIAMQIASSGTYHLSNTGDLEKKQIDNYFIKTGERVQIIKRIRDKIVFSNHNIIKDTPFIKIDLITCRNILIYLNTKTQLKVITNLLFALNPEGILFLGISESLGEASKYFTTIDTKAKIFQNNSGKKPSLSFENPIIKVGGGPKRIKAFKDEGIEIRRDDRSANAFHRFLSKEYSPSCIFFDKNYTILFIKGDAGIHLSLNEGVFESNLLKMVSPLLSEVIQTGVKRLRNTSDEVVINKVFLSEKNQQLSFDLIFKKTPESAGLNEAYMIYFNDHKVFITQNSDFQNISLDELTKTKIEILELNLKETQSELQHVIQELDTSTEELQSSNEELMASNEELQSTNEELQSVNEELYTVNYELQDKNKELTTLNNYITNLFNSTDVGTLFLDGNLNIRNFTPSIKKHFNLKEEDIGRSISIFTSNFRDETRITILDHAKKVIGDLIPIEDELLDNDGNYFFCRINPFVTLERKIDGVVLAFIDITEIKNLNLDLEAHKQKIVEDSIYYKSIIENNSFYVIKTDLQGKYTYFNDYFCKVFGVDPIKMFGANSFELIIPEDHHLCFETVQKCLSEPDKSFWVILRKPTKNGIEHSQWEFKVLLDSKGNMCEMLCIGHEISSLILKQEQLQSLVDVNIEQNKRLMQFTHIISHNIRSHISNLKGIVAHVERHPEETHSEFWTLIKQTTNSLDETILNLNDSITIQTSLNIPLKEIHLTEKINMVENSLSNIISESKVVVKYIQDCEDDLIYANPAYLDSILLNLISNSIKYRSELRIPEIIIQLSSIGKFKVLSIKDNGIGIDMQKNRDQLFGMYKTFHRNKDAKGLGLYITKVQVEAMKGKIEVESLLGLGSSFIVYFPHREKENKLKIQPVI